MILVYAIIGYLAFVLLMCFWFHKTRVNKDPVCDCPYCSGEVPEQAEDLDEHTAAILLKCLENPGKPVSGIVDDKGNLTMTVHDEIVELSEDQIVPDDQQVH